MSLIDVEEGNTITMEEVLYTGLVPDIAEFIGDCHFPADALLLLEQLPRYVVADEKERHNLLQFTRLAHRSILPASTSGRVFAPDFELRWQEEHGEYRVVYLGTERKIPHLKDETEKLEGLEKSAQPKAYYLFGEYLDDNRLRTMGLKTEPDFHYYAEVRVPRLLSYPIPNAERRVRLSVCEYIDKATGRVQLYRFQDLLQGE